MTNKNESVLQNNLNKYEDVKTVIKNFLGKLTVEFDNIEILEEELCPIVLIKTADSGILIGNEGEGLKAFNHIIKKIVEKKFAKDKLKFFLDINGYYLKRMKTLKNQAKILAERARMFKSDIEMTPLNAYERMIIHSSFVGDKEIKTESEGEGKMRRIVFKYIKN